MRKWLHETHGPGFELLRHFLRRFFDSDLVTHPGQTATALIGAFALFVPWFPVIVGPLHQKYAYFSKLSAPGPYREAVRADELWLITLTMSAIGLLTALKWQALFPGPRDYRSLAGLPLRARQIFGAKLAALLLVSTAAIVTLALVPSVLFPMVSGGRWAWSASAGARIAALGVSCAAGSYFLFFTIVGLQGILLTVLRPRSFGRVSGHIQGFLAAAMLAAIVLSFSIQARITNAALQPELARWIPPVWFLGLHQGMSGDVDPGMQKLARTAETGLITAAAIAFFTYLLSYRRHRVWLMEGARAPRKGARRLEMRWLFPDPRQRAIAAFLAKTLAHSSQHRTVLMGYGGFGLAILLSGIPGMRGFTTPPRFVAASFVYAHVILLIFLLTGLRHLFSIPVELKANWIFQVTEREGRSAWLGAIDRFVLTWGAALMLLLPFPAEAALLGWRAVAEALLVAVFALLCYEGIFFSWEKLPFTCSYLPGRTPMWILALKLMGSLTVLPLVNLFLVECLFQAWLFVVVLAILTAVWLRVRAMRREARGELRLKYDEAPEPAVQGLGILR